MTRVLVTGAGGFVGRSLIRTLAEAGMNVRAAARRPEAIGTRSGIEPAALPDLATAVDWNSLLSGMDAVIHLAGIGACRQRYSGGHIRPRQPRRDGRPCACGGRERDQAFHFHVVDPGAKRPRGPAAAQ
jgi:NAD(P)-dependent dehydrogenase (short-subunit alcohol dehydrogenase family)